MNSIEVSAKKVDEAIAEGLKKLGVTIDEVDVKILSQGGFLKKAKVLITLESAKAEIKTQPKTEVKTEVKPAPKAEVKPQPKTEAKAEVKAEVKPQPKTEVKAEVKPQAKTEVKPQQKAENKQEAEAKTEVKQPRREDRPFYKKPEVRDNRSEGGDRQFRERRHERGEATAEDVGKVVDFLSVVLEKMNIQGNLEAKAEDGIKVEIKTEDSAVIGYRGEVLDALTYLSGVVLNERGGKEKYIQISVDALNYREKRVAILENLARKMADKAVNNNKKIMLEPMASHERKVIHAVLSENQNVITRSEGHEPSRRIVILPKRK